MANFRRRRSAVRTASKTYYKWTAKRREDRFGSRSWLHSWPAWHDIIHHRRPNRRKARVLERALELDRLDPDEAVWPLSRRPHTYFW
jgi:hypothetical protein